MNVVMIGPFGLHPKGTMRARAMPAARALAARGHRVHVLMPPWHTPAEAGRSWLDPAGVAVANVSLTGSGVPVLGRLAVAGRLARGALALEPDVVHAFKPKAYSGLAAAFLRVRQRLGARFALVMDADDWEGPGGWNELAPYGPAMRRFFAWQERWGLAHADAVTVASRALETLAWSLGVARERVMYLPNALGTEAAGAAGAAAGAGATGAAASRVPVAEGAGAGSVTTAVGVAAASDPAAAERPPVILLYTRFFEFDLARPLEVLARVRLRHPTARLLVAGQGLQGEERHFLALAGARGLAEAVDYRGWVAAADAPALFAAADVALYPFDDTLVNRAKCSVKVLELLGAGLPVVAEAVGELPAVIADGRSGRLVPAGDVEAFASAASDLLADPAGRRAMGAAAAASVRADHHWRRRVADLEAVYRAAMAAR